MEINCDGNISQKIKHLNENVSGIKKLMHELFLYYCIITKRKFVQGTTRAIIQQLYVYLSDVTLYSSERIKFN